MKQFTLKRMALCAMALLFAGGASAVTTVKVYDFTRSSDTNPSTTTGSVDVTTDRTYKCIYLSDGTNTFDNQFAWGVRYDGTTDAKSENKFKNAGLYYTYDNRVLAILDLNKGDVITFNVNAGSFKFRGTSIVQGAKADDVIASGKRYFVKSAGNQVIYSSAANSSISSIVIESETEFIGDGDVVATPGGVEYSDYSINSTTGLIDATLKNWSRQGSYLTTWPTEGVIRTTFDIFPAGSCAESSTAPTETSGNPTAGPYVVFKPKYNGILQVFGDFSGTTKFKGSEDSEPLQSYATSWQIMTYAVTANKTYYLWNTESSRRRICGYRFTPEFGVSISDMGNTTFGNYTNSAFSIPSGLTAYAAKYTSGDYVDLTKVDYINKSQGVYINGDKGVYAFTVSGTSDGTNFEGNQLKMVSAEYTVKSDGSNTNYVYGSKGDNAGFYKISTSGITLPAGKAYLQIPVSSAPSFLNIEFGGTTGINKVQDSGLKVQGSDTYYNLAGQRVAQPTKGLYIVNGKKVIIK
ncbi:MAG: hypothetical protein J6O49_09590 [Bacteroidaceae bacterium]|nr:hypothetical protein [Bacteroidaceae bacterium]